jgi:NADPH:quinone reductase
VRAIIIDETSPARALRCEIVPEPTIESTDLLVAVKVAGVNRADLRRAVTHFAASTKKPSPVAGLELAGEVVALGADVRGFAIGDRVMAMANGAFAERATIDYRLAVKVPSSMAWEIAAATPVAFITAHNALITAGAFKAGETVLVQGASAGAGIATVQIARLRGASKIFGTAGTPEKLTSLRSLGCDVVINYRDDGIASIISEQTGSRGIDVTIDYAGGNMVQKNIDAAGVRGRIVCAGRVAGTDATVNIDEFSRKQIRMTGVTNRTRSLNERIKVVHTFRDDLLSALEDKTLVPVVDKVYALEEAEAAQEYMRSNQHFGKIVLKI